MDDKFILEEGLDQVFGALSDERRRDALGYIVENQGCTVNSVAGYLSDSFEESGLIQTELYHNHLPRLEDAEMINYDGEFAEASENAVQALENLDRCTLLQDRSEFLEILSNDRRIAALSYLSENNETSVEQMAEDLGETGEEMYELKMEFELNHLPRLEEAGLIQYQGENVKAQEEAVKLSGELEEMRF